MENKIQQLTQQLYTEGVAKGKQESEQLIAQAKEQSAQILAEAKEAAAKIIETAKSEAESQKELSLASVRRSGEQMVSQVKSQIQNLVVSKVVSDDVKKALSDESFMQELILESVKAWSTKSDSGIVLSIAQEKADQIEKYLKAKIDAAISAKLTIEVSPSIKNGFTISPKDQGYYISFTSEEFDALLAESLSAKISEIVFGK